MSSNFDPSSLSADEIEDLFPMLDTSARMLDTVPVTKRAIVHVKTLLRPADGLSGKAVEIVEQSVSENVPAVAIPADVPPVGDQPITMRNDLTKSGKPRKQRPPENIQALAIIAAYKDGLDKYGDGVEIGRNIVLATKMAKRGVQPEDVEKATRHKMTDKFYSDHIVSLEYISTNLSIILDAISGSTRRRLDDGMDDRGRFNLRNTQEYRDDLAERSRPKTAEEQMELDNAVRRAKEEIERMSRKS